jgi:hypothetical protein
VSSEGTLRLLLQLCSALGAAHAQGIVHRDLKPGNLMLVSTRTDTDVLKVLDFGMAKLIDAGSRTITDRNQVIGTPGYLSPEQIQKETVDERTDLYAFGCIGYELLSGAPPFHGSLPEVLRAQLDSEPAPLAPEDRIGRGLVPILMECLRKSPADRPASAEVVALKLDALVSPGEPTRRRRTLRTSALTPPPTPTGQHATEGREETNPGADTPITGETQYIGDAIATLQGRWLRKLNELAALHSGGGIGFGEVARRLAEVQRLDAEITDRETQIAVLYAEIDEQQATSIERTTRIRTALGNLRLERSSCAEILDAIRVGDRNALVVWLGRAHRPMNRDSSVANVSREIERTLAELDRQMTELEARLLEVEDEREQAVFLRRSAIRPQEERLGLLRQRLKDLSGQLRRALDTDIAQSPAPGYQECRQALVELEHQLAVLDPNA